MLPISASLQALDAALARHQRAGEALMRRDENADAESAVAEMIEARVQAKAAVSVVRFSDEMFKALIEIAR